MPLVWKLDEIVKKRGVTNRWLALQMGRHENNIYKLKNREDVPRINHETIEKLCDILGCTPGELMDYTPPVTNVQSVRSKSIFS